MVRYHTLGNYGEADLSPVRLWVLDRVGHQPTRWARAFASFRELRKAEVRRTRDAEVFGRCHHAGR